MYLVSADHYHSSRDKRTRHSPFSPREWKSISRGCKHLSYEEWVQIRHKIREADIRRKTRTKNISEYFWRIMPDTTSNSNMATSSKIICFLMFSFVSRVIPKYLMLLACCNGLEFRYTLTSVISFLFLLVASITLDFCSLKILFFPQFFNLIYFYICKVFGYLDVPRPYCYY